MGLNIRLFVNIFVSLVNFYNHIKEIKVLVVIIKKTYSAVSTPILIAILPFHWYKHSPAHGEQYINN